MSHPRRVDQETCNLISGGGSPPRIRWGAPVPSTPVLSCETSAPASSWGAAAPKTPRIILGSRPPDSPLTVAPQNPCLVQPQSTFKEPTNKLARRRGGSGHEMGLLAVTKADCWCKWHWKSSPVDRKGSPRPKINDSLP